jgi:hypothetical protein
MTDLKPYWFLEGTIDLEYQFYILMSYLVKVKESFNNQGFERYFKNLISVRKDLESFDKTTEFTQKTMSRMTEEDKDRYHKLLDDNLDNIGEIEAIVKNSLRVIKDFLDENYEMYEKYDSLVDVESYCSKFNLWDQGFLVVRREDEEKMRIFTWFFSIVKISQKESVALLMTEMLDPKCETTKDIKKIKRFLKSNIAEFSEKHDCVMVADVSNEIDHEIGIEISKEKSIDIIRNKFKG